MKTFLLLFLTPFLSFFLPNLLEGQVPNLGQASSFTVFSAIGAISNTGTTTIADNAGTNVGAFTGSPTVLGQTHVADTTSASAATSVIAAYAYLFIQVCDSILGTTLGGNQVLAPNIYCMGAATSLNGDLILDGQNDSTAIFIFQIDGAFSSSTSSSIILVNKASSCNVYWQVNGAVDIGSSSVFRGNIIANGAISLLSGSIVEGRVLTKAGAISLDNNLVTECLQSVISLPVKFISFSAEKDFGKAAVNLSWQTSMELNTAYFLVERSTDGINWKTIGKQQAGGNSQQVLDYFFTDNSPALETNYYRLNQYDFDGRHEYSHIKVVYFNNTNLAVSIYPNPFSGSIGITINNASHTNEYQFQLYDALGREVMNMMICEPLICVQIKHIPSGIYSYKVTGENEFVKSGRLVAL